MFKNFVLTIKNYNLLPFHSAKCTFPRFFLLACKIYTKYEIVYNCIYVKLARNSIKNEVIKTLQKWRLEADSGHNDGWTQKHYQDKIDEVVSYLVETELED